MRDRALPDTPWHVGYTKKAEDDPRRHKSRCVHIESGKCRLLEMTCAGSMHCVSYAETWEQWEKVHAATLSNEEEHRLRAIKYQMIKRNEWYKMLERIGQAQINLKYSKALSCPICTERLREHKCNYCGFQTT